MLAYSGDKVQERAAYNAVTLVARASVGADVVGAHSVDVTLVCALGALVNVSARRSAITAVTWQHKGHVGHDGVGLSLSLSLSHTHTQTHTHTHKELIPKREKPRLTLKEMTHEG